MDTDQIKKEIGMMNLEDLIADREEVPEVTFPVPESEVLDRFAQLYTGAVSDVLRENCRLEQSLPSYIRPLDDSVTVAGFAFTVKCTPSSLIRGEMEVRTKMLDAMPPDVVILYDTSGDDRAAMWGGVMTATAMGKGARAAVIDGCIRDTHQIRERKFPVYYKGHSPDGSLSRCLITHYQIPIRIGRVDIKPGDVIVADIDGVVCVPRTLAWKVLTRAEEILRNEKQIFSSVDEGRSVRQIADEGGYF